MTYKKRLKPTEPPTSMHSKIPKIAHFYWGNKIMPYLRYVTIKSFAKFNPSWQVRLYVPDSPNENKTWSSHEQKYEITAKDYWPKLKDPSFKDANVSIIPFDAQSIGYSNDLPEVIKSDLLRWSLLSSVGGLWSDMDIVYFKPMDSALRDNADSYICCHDFHSIGFMMGSENDTFYREVNDVCRNIADWNDYQGAGSHVLTQHFGYKHHQIIGRYRRLHKTIYNIPMNVVYPVTNIDEICNPDIINQAMKRINAQTIGLHWYAGHPMLAEYVSNMVPETLDQYKNILAHFVRQVQIV